MLIEATAGWPLAVQAVLSNGPHTESLDADPRISLARLPARLSLVANDFLMLLGSAKQRRALLAVAYCPGLSARAFATAILTQSHEEHASETYKLALRIFSEVSDLGLIAHERPPQTDRYRCHPGLESEFSRMAEQEFSENELKRLVREHAADLAIDDPFSAVVLYCEVDDFAAAERLMVSHHAEVTGIDRGLGRTMRGIPTEKLAGFPMLAAARLVIGIFDKLTSDEWVRTNLEALRGDVLRILAEGQAETETSAYWVLMFVERMLGNQELAMSLARELEQRLGERPQKPGLQMSGSTSFAYVQLGFTAILNGDFEFASRCYGRASRLSTESGALTEQIRALYGLALSAYANGRMQGAQEFVERAERLEREWSELGPQLVAFEIAPVRVILAASQGDEAEMKRLFDEMTPLCRRLETWPLILLAEAKMNCRSHGNYSALSVLCSRLAEGKRVVATTNYLKTGLTLSVIGMQMRLGNLASAEQQLQNLPDQTVEKSLATARIMLLRDAAEQANLILETELPGPLNRQQRCEYLLLSAVTSWRMGFREEALRDFIETVSTMEEHDGYQQLSTTPYETLLALAQEAERAGVEGILRRVTNLPENARCYQYELLGWECGRQTRRMTSCGY